MQSARQLRARAEGANRAQDEFILIDSVEAAVEAIHPLADSRRIDLTTDLSSEVGIVHVDPDRIQQVVWNLLANAVKFTPQGGQVHVRVARADGTVEIEVRDTGIGIREDFLPHVFDRFRQADGYTVSANS